MKKVMIHCATDSEDSVMFVMEEVYMGGGVEWLEKSETEDSDDR